MKKDVISVLILLMLIGAKAVFACEDPPCPPPTGPANHEKSCVTFYEVQNTLQD